MKKKNQSNKEYYKQFPWKRTLVDIKTRCTNKNHVRYARYGGRGIECNIISDELEFLWCRDKAYNMKKPSIDREDNDGNYELSNCRYIELSKNSSIANQGIKLKPVIQYDLNGNFIEAFLSIKDAERKLELSEGGIGKCCNGLYKTMYGYKWAFKLDN